MGSQTRIFEEDSVEWLSKAVAAVGFSLSSLLSASEIASSDMASFANQTQPLSMERPAVKRCSDSKDQACFATQMPFEVNVMIEEFVFAKEVRYPVSGRPATRVTLLARQRSVFASQRYPRPGNSIQLHST